MSVDGNETLQTIWKRKSIRRYQDADIPDEDLTLILEAARRAPTGSNRQNWRMVVVRDPELRRQTAEACNGQMWMAQAPVILCLVVTPGEGKVNGAIVLDHAVLAATSLGYGTCWIGAYSATKVRGVLGIPEDHDIVNLIPIGVPADDPKPRGRKRASELFSVDRFGNSLDFEPVELSRDA